MVRSRRLVSLCYAICVVSRSAEASRPRHRVQVCRIALTAARALPRIYMPLPASPLRDGRRPQEAARGQGEHAARQPAAPPLQGQGAPQPADARRGATLRSRHHRCRAHRRASSILVARASRLVRVCVAARPSSPPAPHTHTKCPHNIAPRDRHEPRVHCGRGGRGCGSLNRRRSRFWSCVHGGRRDRRRAVAGGGRDAWALARSRSRPAALSRSACGAATRSTSSRTRPATARPRVARRRSRRSTSTG